MSRHTRIAFVDDDPHLREMLADYFGTQGYDVLLAADGAGLTRLMATHALDIVLLDVHMPGEDGFAVLRRIRLSSPALPIIMLTSDAAKPSKLGGLHAGADDYVVKPFDLRELLARVRAVLYRAARAAGPGAPHRARAPIGPFVLDHDGRQLLDAAGQDLSLTALEFDIFAALAESPGRIVGRSRLQDLAGEVESDRAIDVRMSRLRRKLHDAGAPAGLIRTIRGEGYVLEPN